MEETVCILLSPVFRVTTRWNYIQLQCTNFQREKINCSYWRKNNCF